MGTLILALAWSIHPALAQEPKDAQDVLTAYGAELLKGIKQTNDTALRSRLITSAKTAFANDLKTAVNKVPKSKWDYHQLYLSNLIQADKRYTTEDTKPERSAWITACKAVFSFQLLHAAEPAAPVVTTEEVFTELFAGIDKVRKDVPNASSADIRSAAYIGARQVFSERLVGAHAPVRSPQSIYTEQLIKIDKVYPLPQAAPPPPVSNTPAKSTASSSGGGKSSGGGGSAPPPKEEYDFHTEPNGILKAGAKQAFDKSLTAPK
ncbi:MAG TPA: hypothetical protein VEN81_09275 [Planctomycetota bacterium]|nr:hypothetical protein [Planctomycetota bacterium]